MRERILELDKKIEALRREIDKDCEAIRAELRALQESVGHDEQNEFKLSDFGVGQVWLTRGGELRLIVAIIAPNPKGDVISICSEANLYRNFGNGHRYPHGEIERDDLIQKTAMPASSFKITLSDGFIIS